MAKIFNNTKLLCFDVDGTITTGANKMLTETKEQLFRVRDLGYKILLNTGRSRPDLLSFMRENNFYTSAIILNGACIMDDNLNVIDEEYMDEDSVLKISEIFRKYNLPFVSYYSDKILCSDSAYMKIMYKNFSESDLTDLANGMLFDDISDYKHILKIEACFEDLDLVKEVKEKINNINNVNCVSSMGFNLEVTSNNTNKGKKLLKYIEKLGYKETEVMFFGDSENDAAAFELFENSVYVKNNKHDFYFDTKYKTLSSKENGVGLFLKNNF